MEKFSSSAKVIDGTLILTLPDAIKPVVWQMQLGQTKSSALEVRDMPDGNWMLVLKTPRMDVMEIAPFSNKDNAIRALLAVSRAMEKAHGQLGNSGGYPLPVIVQGRGGVTSWIAKIMKAILYTFMTLFILVVLWLSYMWIRSNSGSQEMAQPALAPPAATAEAPPETPVGAPVSADDYLNNQ